MEYTSNYQLPVWAETDRILRTDFNEAYQKLDAALAALTAADGTLESAIASGGNARIVHGTYVGTGASRQGNECTLTFELPPLLVVVCPHTPVQPRGDGPPGDGPWHPLGLQHHQLPEHPVHPDLVRQHPVLVLPQRIHPVQPGGGNLLLCGADVHGNHTIIK